MRWLIGAVLTGGLVIAAGGWLYAKQPPRNAAVSTPPPPVQIAVEASPVEVGPIRRQIEAVGSLRSNESVIIRSEIPGRIGEILFEEGHSVTRGTPLIKLDATVAQGLAGLFSDPAGPTAV